MITAIIPALREVETLMRLLRSLERPGNHLDRIVVAVGPDSEPTKHVCTEWSNRLNIEVVDARIGVSAARNDGAAAVGGGWLVFLDADADLPTGFVVQLLSKARHDAATVAATAFRAYSGGVAMRAAARAIACYFSLFQRTGSPAANGSCILIQADAFRYLRGFDEGLRWGEDHDLVRRAVAAGLHFRYYLRPTYSVSSRRFDTSIADAVANLRPYVRAEIRRLGQLRNGQPGGPSAHPAGE